MRILVVDDFEPIRNRLAAMLRDLPGASVLEASHGDEALALCRAAAFHAVVLDLHMPGPNALAVIGAIKSLAPAPRVIVLTGQPTEHHRRSCIAAGADWFFDKALEFQETYAVLARLTTPRSRSDTTSPPPPMGRSRRGT